MNDLDDSVNTIQLAANDGSNNVHDVKEYREATVDSTKISHKYSMDSLSEIKSSNFGNATNDATVAI